MMRKNGERKREGGKEKDRDTEREGRELDKRRKTKLNGEGQKRERERAGRREKIFYWRTSLFIGHLTNVRSIC